MDIIVAFLYIILALLLLGIVIAFSPTLVITELAVLTKSKRPVLNTAILIAGISLPIIILSLLALIAVDPNKEIHLPNIRESIGPVPIADIIAGILLVIGSIKLMNKPHPGKSPNDAQQSSKLMSSSTLFWFGAIKMATSASSIAAILYASRFLKTNTTESLQQLAGVFWLTLIAVTPFIIIALSRTFSPRSFAKIQHYSDIASDLDWRRIIATLMAIFGIFLVVYGIFTIEQARIL